jgi:hypothetical protein
MELIQQPRCTVCRSQKLLSRLSFGKQLPSNRFVSSGACSSASEDYYLLSLGYCQQCGTIQLVNRMPTEVVRSRHDWLVYSEPERHLDEVASDLCGMSCINVSSKFLGITDQDRTILDRVGRLGFSNKACISESDWNSSKQPFGLETIQQIISIDYTVARLRKIYGCADVIFARYIIEHASDVSNLIGSLRGLLEPDGYMMFELPDSEKIFRADNHPFIWEEHISYFTESSIKQLAQSVGARLVWLKRYSSAYEDTLNVLFSFAESDKASSDSLATTAMVSAAVLDKFSKGFDASREKWHKMLKACRARGERVAVFGAGHLAAKFINFYELKNLIDCVIDDHPKKVNMIMSGSRLKIVSSEELFSRGIKVCISTLSPESEIKVRGKLASFFDAGGCFVPAFSIV